MEWINRYIIIRKFKFLKGNIIGVFYKQINIRVVHLALLPYDHYDLGQFPDLQSGDYNVPCAGFWEVWE